MPANRWTDKVQILESVHKIYERIYFIYSTYSFIDEYFCNNIGHWVSLGTQMDF